MQNFKVEENDPGGHTHMCPSEIPISAPDGPRHLNMGFKMTAIIDFMGTQGNFEALERSVFKKIAKNGTTRSRESEIAISGCESRRHVNMGFKMTAIIDFMGTEGNFEVLEQSVFT